MTRYTLKQYIEEWHGGKKAQWAKVAGVHRQHVNKMINDGWLVFIEDSGKRYLFQPHKREWTSKE